MRVIYNDTELQNQEWFDNFRWYNFRIGDVVWLEDNDETDKPAALFGGIDEEKRVYLRGTSYQNAYRIEMRTIVEESEALSTQERNPGFGNW